MRAQRSTHGRDDGVQQLVTGSGGGGKGAKKAGGGRPDWKKHVGARSESKKARRRRRAKQKVAIIVVQRLVRGFLGRRACARLAQRTRDFDQYRASVRIQVQIRRVLSAMRVDRIRTVRRTAAAIVIQRRARGGRRVYARMYRIRLTNIQLEDTSAFTQICWKSASSMQPAEQDGCPAYPGDHAAKGARRCRTEIAAARRAKACRNPDPGDI